jgi:hypothetical protein
LLKKSAKSDFGEPARSERRRTCRTAFNKNLIAIGDSTYWLPNTDYWLLIKAELFSRQFHPAKTAQNSSKLTKNP